MCAEKIGIRGRRSFEMLVCMMLRSRVRLRLLCGLYVFAANARMCVAEARSPWSHLGRYMSVVSGAIPRDCTTHVCCINKEPVVTIFCVDVSANTVVLQNASCYLGSFHLIVRTRVCLQKPGIGGRSWHLWCLRMFQSMSKLVRVLVAASNRLSRFLRRRLRRCVSKSRSQLSWVLLRCLCVALVVTIARGEHCACVSAHTHTHVCCKSKGLRFGLRRQFDRT